MYRYRDDFSSDLGSGLIGIVLFLALLGAFLMVVAVVFVVRTFVKYPSQRKTLWIALAACVVSCVGAGLLYRLTSFDGSGALAGIGIAGLLITCLVLDLQNRDTLLRENVSLVDAVLRSPWWGAENTPLPEQEIEHIAA
jgi:hypothetical protein